MSATKSISRNLTSYKFRQEIAVAVFAATPPSVLKPISTSNGVFLIWVEEIVQPILDQHLRDQIQQELFSAWLKQQIESMEILTMLDSNAHLQASEDVLMQA